MEDYRSIIKETLDKFIDCFNRKYRSYHFENTNTNDLDYLFNITDVNFYKNNSFITEYENLILDMIQNIIIELSKEKGYSIKNESLKLSTSRTLLENNNTTIIEKYNDTSHYLSLIICKIDDKKIAFIPFVRTPRKKPTFHSQFPRLNILEKIKNHFSLDSIYFVSTIVLKSTKNSKLDYEISIIDFINDFVDKDAAFFFEKYSKNITSIIEKIYGISTISKTNKSTLFDFKYHLQTQFTQDNYLNKLFPSITPETINLLKTQFLEAQKYKILFGNNKISESFVTSEWLYENIKNIDGVDLSLIVQGYFKSLEQFMHLYLYCLDKEFPNNHYVLYKSKYQKKVKLSCFFNDPKNENSLSLGNMSRFFYDFSSINKNLLNSSIEKNNEAIDLISKTLKTISYDRNTFFHRENIIDINKVEEIRLKSTLALILLISSYEFNNTFMNELSITCVSDDTFFKLCKYIESNPHDEYSFDGTLYYSTNPKQIEYVINENNDPVYLSIIFNSSIFQRSKSNENEKILSKDEIINELYVRHYRVHDISNIEQEDPFDSPRLLIKNNIFNN